MSEMEIKHGKKLLEVLGAGDLIDPVHLVADQGTGKGLVDKLAAPPEAVHLAGSLDKAALEDLSARTSGAKTVIGVGGPATLMVARYAAWKAEAGLVLVPAPLCGEASVGARVKARDEGLVKVLGEKSPDLVLVDMSLIWAADEDESRSAVGEVLSIVTAVEDWKLSGAAGEAEYNEDVALEAMEMVTGLLDRADDIYDLTESGVKKMVELFAAREDFAKKHGGRHLVEGSETVFADCVEAAADKPMDRGALLCLGVVLMMELQGKPSKPAKQFLHWVRVPWKPEQLGISDDRLAEVMASLKEFDAKRSGHHTVIREAPLDGGQIKKVIAAAKEPFLKSSFQERTD